MSLISKDQVIQDTRDAYVSITGDTTPITYGGATGLATKVRTLGKLLDNTITFKVDTEDYYISSCKTSASISAPPTPTVTSFSYWATTTGTSVSFPYTPTGSTILTAVYGGTPTPGVDVTYTTENIEELGGEIIGVEFVVPRLGLVGGESYTVSIIYADSSTQSDTYSAIDLSEEMGEPEGTVVYIPLSDYTGIYDGVYFDSEGQETVDSTKCGIVNAKDIVTENPVLMSSITIQGPVESN